MLNNYILQNKYSLFQLSTAGVVYYPDVLNIFIEIFIFVAGTRSQTWLIPIVQAGRWNFRDVQYVLKPGH